MVLLFLNFHLYLHARYISPHPPPRQKIELVYLWSIFWEKSDFLFYLSHSMLKIRLSVIVIFNHRILPVLPNFFIILGLYSLFQKVLLIRNIYIIGNWKIIFMAILTLTLALRLRINEIFHSSVKKTTFWVKKKWNPWLFLLSAAKETSIRMSVPEVL